VDNWAAWAYVANARAGRTTLAVIRNKAFLQKLVHQ
jgi:hypothetical protein